jgi:hypothetical protein
VEWFASEIPKEMNCEIQPPLMPHERVVRCVILGVVAFCVTVLAVKAVGWPVPVLPCGFRAVSGLPCAMCGGTRAVAALAAGDWKQALEWNALAVPVLAAMAFVSAVCLVELMRGRALMDWSRIRKWPARFLVPGLGLLLAWWIFHVREALENPGSGLADREKPVASAVAGWLGIR